MTDGILRNRAFLSIFFIVLGLVACDPAEPPWRQRPYYDVYDEAVNLYYKPPRRPAEALRLLEIACRRNRDRQDLSCYNLGVLRELEGRPRLEALDAYQRAWRLKPNPAYQAAAGRLATSPRPYKSAYLESTARAVRHCQSRRPGRALSELRQISRQLPAGTRLYRETFAQPFFADCLAGEPGYRAWLDSLPTRPGDLATDLVRTRARRDEFSGVWDLELFLKRDGETQPSAHPVTAEWQDFVLAAREGDQRRAALHLQACFDAVDTIARQAPRERSRALAIKRAAAILIDGDPFFFRVRGSPALRAVTGTVLR